MSYDLTDELTNDEYAWLWNNRNDRCKACGHLEVLHADEDNGCLVSKCSCRWGELDYTVEQKKREREEKRADLMKKLAELEAAE
jgi:hypothetical protein